MEHNMDNRLWDYIDGSSAGDKLFVEQLIATQQTWRARYHELLGTQQLLNSSLELDQPSMRFSQNIMEAITKYQITPATKTYINKKIIYGIGIFFAVMIAGMLVYGLGQVNWSDGGGSTTGVLTKYNPGKINFSKFINNTYTTIFMMINVVLGLMLLDMWLGKKKNADVKGLKG
jgi:magnesium-transporting ATPase (P-type)